MPKMHWRPGLCPGPHDAPPDLLVGWGGGHQSQCPTPSAPKSILASSALRSSPCGSLVPPAALERAKILDPTIRLKHWRQELERHHLLYILCTNIPMLFQRKRRMRPMPSECRSPSGRNCSCSSRISRSSSSINFFLHHVGSSHKYVTSASLQLWPLISDVCDSSSLY